MKKNWIGTTAISACLGALLCGNLPAQDGAEVFAFNDGDLVCFLGNTVVERAQRHGHIEAALTLAAGHEKNLRFRNLGWSGDTVFGHARSYFGPPSEGFSRLSGHIGGLKPTVVMVCYGSLNAFDSDPAADDTLIAGYATLLDMIEAKSGGARIVILSPPPLENLGAPLPDQSQANARLAKTRDRLREFAGGRGAFFVDLFELMGGGSKAGTANLTENGVHYTDAGYRVIAEKLVTALGLEWKGDPGEGLRDLIRSKNTLFFDRWRPANETYLHGFRKHEQGQNAKEMAEFDPLIDGAEQKITAAVRSLLGK